MNSFYSSITGAIGVAFIMIVGFVLSEYILDLAGRRNSHKDVVCTGAIVLSGSGVVYKDGNTYTLAGKTYQMKDGETCWINDSYMNVEVKQ